MVRENLEQELRDIVAEIIEVEPQKIQPGSDFVEALGMDSMQALEIMAAIEKKYNVQIPEDYLGKIMNLNSLVELSSRMLGEK